MDFVVRMDYSEDLRARIESISEKKEELGQIQDTFYKPEGKKLENYSPRNVIVRKRKFPEKETLVKINIIQKPTGYTDTKEKVENLEGYEKWGSFTSSAIEYTIPVEDKEVPILVEEFDFGKFIKIESPSLEKLERVLQELGLERKDVIEKNSAELLAEHMGKL